ncbi:MAG: molecular chaperone DnaJ [Cyanobacteria bacterium P01_G01_bin.54]
MAKSKNKKTQRRWVRVKTPVPAPPNIKTVTLSQTPLHQKFFDLQKDRQWLLKQIKRKRTELDNFIEGVRSLASEVFKQGAEPMQRLQALDAEIHQLFDDIFTKRKLGKKSRKDIERVYRSLQMMGVISPKLEFFEDEDEDEWDEPPSFEADDPDFAGGSNPFNGCDGPEPTPDRPENQRDMRQTFLRLASIYHPDRAEDEDTQAIHTEIMKEINRAYKDGDFARLLELEKQQQSGELDATELESGDDLEQACQTLERENHTLREQYEGIKAELRNLRNNTQEGEMLKTYRRTQKMGIDMFEQMMLEANEEIEQIEEIRDFVKAFRDRKVTIKDFLKGPTGSQGAVTSEDMMMALEDLLGVRVTIDPDLF